MKKTIFLPLLLCILVLPSCGDTPANIEEVNRLKDLLSKQDLSPAYDKMFVSNFAQNYDVFSSVSGGENEEGAETRFYSYRGGGAFGCLYEVSEASYAEVEALENHDFFDYLSRGTGDYGMVQTATLVSYLYENTEAELIRSLQSLTFFQNLDARFTEDKVQVYNSLYAREELDGGYDADSRQGFNGIIDKGTLFDTITVRAFSDIFARTNLFDGQRSCEVLDRIYFDTVKELCSKSDAELSEFISKNDIRIDDDGEKTKLHFKVGDEQLRAILDENDIIPGALEGTLSYEKESGKFTDYDYKIAYVANESDEYSGNVHTTTMEFKANGYSLKQKYGGEPYINPDATVYDDAEKFLDDVVKEVIPPSI